MCVWITHLVALRSGEGGGTVPPLLQRAQTGLSTSLMEHMGQKLLKGEEVTDEASQGQYFDLLLLMKHV